MVPSLSNLSVLIVPNYEFYCFIDTIVKGVQEMNLERCKEERDKEEKGRGEKDIGREGKKEEWE